jgi:hypothetical protein
METKSIFLNPPVIRGSIEDQIAILATEQSVCEAHLKMGYTHSIGVSIASRVAYLDKEIQRLSDLRRR